MSHVGIVNINHNDRELDLPFSIGSSFKDNIYINDDDIKAGQYVVFEESGVLVCYNQKGEYISKSELSDRYEINLIGCIKAGEKGLAIKLAKMRQSIADLPPAILAFLFFSLPKPFRYAGYTSIVLTLILTGLNSQRHKTKIAINESSVIQHLKSGITNKKQFRDDVSNPNGRQFRDGVVFEIDLGKNESALPGRLSFWCLGMSDFGNIIIKINEKTVYVNEVNENCISKACSQLVIVRKKFTKPGVNRIAFIHGHKDKNWVVAEVKFETTRPLNPVEKKQFDN